MLKFFYIVIIFCIVTPLFASKDFNHATYAVVQLLNKLTGKTEQVTLSTNSVYRFDKNLQVVLKQCYKSVHSDSNENKAFFQIARLVYDKEELVTSLNQEIAMPKEIVNTHNTTEATNHLIFSGWMFSSSPSISLLKDRIYSVVLLKCNY